MTCEKTQYFKLYAIFILLYFKLYSKLTTPVVIATSQTFQFSQFYSYLPLVYVPCSTGLKQLLKYQLGVWVAPTTNFMAAVTLPLVLTTVVKISNVE